MPLIVPPDLWVPPTPAIIRPAPPIKGVFPFSPFMLPTPRPLVFAHTVDAFDPTNNQSTYTFSGVSIGPVDSTRRVIVVSNGSAAIAYTSVSIGGVVADEHIDYNGIGVHSAAVPAGTTATIVVTYANATVDGCAISVYTVVGDRFDTAVLETKTNKLNSADCSVTITGGVGFGVVGGFGYYLDPISLSGTGITQYSDLVISGTRRGASAGLVNSSGTITNHGIYSFARGIAVAYWTPIA